MNVPTDSIPFLHVMLVEDNPGDAFLIQEMLSEVKGMDFRYQVADRLSAALEQLNHAMVDVLLVDLSLPDSKGLDTLVTLHTQEPSIPIVVLTGEEDEVMGVKAVQQGAQDYLIKGQVTSSLLARALRYAVERKRTEDQLQQVAAQLEHSNHELKAMYAKVSGLEQLKTDMIRIASHDLLGLVSIIDGYLGLLRSDIWSLLDPKQREFFEQIVSTNERMEKLTRDILSLDRIESAAANQQHILDLRSLVKTAFYQNQGQTEHKTQQYYLDVPVTPLMIKGDVAQLHEAIINLVNNAIKYTPDHGTVSVCLKQDGDMAVFEVQDTGYGIPAAMQEHLFQAFFRAKTSETRHIAGTGLGLYLVKRVIERHRGQVHFSSVQGEGSLFGFRLPLDLQAQTDLTNALQMG